MDRGCFRVQLTCRCLVHSSTLSISHEQELAACVVVVTTMSLLSAGLVGEEVAGAVAAGKCDALQSSRIAKTKKARS